jgi:hypothetical protein
MGALLALIPVFSKLIEKIFPDKAEQDQAKLELQKALNEASSKVIEAQKDVITTEMNNGGFASQWRSYLMMICIAIVGYNWIIVSLLNAFLKPFGLPIESVPVPPELWTLVTVGLGGYLGKETMSAYSQAKYGPANDERFFSVLRQKIFKSGMTQDQVDVLEEALKQRDGN